MMRGRKAVIRTGAGKLKPVHVLFFGDLDPSGLDIYRHLQESLTWFGVRLKLKRCAITPENVERYKGSREEVYAAE
jgi:hypothetical protein